MNSQIAGKGESELFLVHIYMVQIDESSFTVLKNHGAVNDDSINTYLRHQAGILPPVEPDWADQDTAGEADVDKDDDSDIIDWSIPVSQAPRVPPHCVPVAGDVYDFFQKDSAEPEQEIASLLRQWAEEINQSQSRSR
jgi:hypothetical protein